MKRLIGLITVIVLATLSQPVWLVAQVPVTMQAERVAAERMRCGGRE